MLNPDQFKPNEAWIAFTLNEAPIHTERDGLLNCIALMDAASCFILGNELVPARQSEPSNAEAQRLLMVGWEHKKQFPATLFVPAGQFQSNLSAEARRLGISVISVHESQLQAFVAEARQGFREYLQQSKA